MPVKKGTRERFEIPVEPPDCLDGAVIYLCLLAYPLPTEAKRRARLYWAFWAYLIRQARKYQRAKKGSNPQHSEILRRYPSQQMWGTLSLANRRIMWRTIAAEYFMFFGSMNATTRTKKHRREPKDVNRDRFWTQEPVLPMPKGFHGERRFEDGSGFVWHVHQFKYIDEHRKPRLTHLVRSISRLLKMPERNVWSQVVRPVRPVLHMAHGLRSTMLERLDLSDPRNSKGVAVGPFDCLALVRSPAWVKRALSIAESTAKYWRAYAEWPALNAIDPSRFIKLVPK